VAAPFGNQNGLKGRIWAEALRRAISRKANGDLNHGLDSLADKLVQSALDGEQWAILELGNRLDGKPAQAVSIEDPDGQPIGLAVVYGRTEDRVSTEAPNTLSS